MIFRPLFWLLLSALMLQSQAAESPKAVGRVERLSAAQMDGVGVKPGASAGLFIGIAEFDGNSGLPKLRYTVDDAIRLADLFIEKLGLLPANNCQLALGGTPSGDVSKERLAKLEALGVKVTGATKTELIDALRDIAGRAKDPKGIVVVALSTHGFEEKGAAYIMPTDGRQDELEETGIRIETIRSRLERSAAPSKKLLIVDACREVPVASVRGSSKMSVAFTDAFKTAKGFAVLTACAPGEQSWEDPDLEHGVFTAQLCNAFEAGGARGDKDGFIRLGNVMAFASEATKDHVDRKRRQVQSPNYSGDESARQIPLAFDTDMGKLSGRKAEALKLLSAAVLAGSEITLGMQNELTEAVRDAVDPRLLERLLGKLESLQDNTQFNRRDVARFWELERREYGFRAKPKILTQPKSQRAKQGNDVSFRVRAEGQGLAFAWEVRRKGAEWQPEGSDEDSLELTNLAAKDDALEVRVRVSNADGEVLSEVAKLTLAQERRAGPKITGQPRSQKVKSGGDAMFRVRTEGSGLSYRWETRRSGAEWEAEDSSGESFEVTGVTSRDNGMEVRVRVSNADGDVLSEAAKLTVERKAEPKITSHPRSQAARLFGSASFRVKAEGENLSYAWEIRRPGSDWESALSLGESYEVSSATVLDHGLEVRVRVSNDDGETISQVARLTLPPRVQLFSAPGRVFEIVDGRLIEGAFEAGRMVAASPGWKYQIQWTSVMGGGFSQVDAVGNIYNVYPTSTLHIGILTE